MSSLTIFNYPTSCRERKIQIETLFCLLDDQIIKLYSFLPFPCSACLFSCFWLYTPRRRLCVPTIRREEKFKLEQSKSRTQHPLILSGGQLFGNSKLDMVGLFSKFGRAGHRRTQSALDEREVLPPNADASGTANATVVAPHGIEIAVEFKPVEHPTEPFDNDQPIQCPLPEPSILNDGRIWKERVSATVRRRGDLPVMKEGGAPESEAPSPRPRPNRLILPSMSAPEHNLLKLLEECNASGI